MFKNVAIVEQDRLFPSLQESESTIANLIAQMDDAKRMNEEPKSDLVTKKCRSKYLASELEAKDKCCQKQKGEMENLIKDFKKCQDELKVRIQFDGCSKALDKMLIKQKHSKDTRGIRCDADECSTSKDVSNKGIQFVSSSRNDKGKTFTIRNAPWKKVDLIATGEDMRMKNSATKMNKVDPKGKGKVR